jgi:hypothetical protein
VKVFVVDNFVDYILVRVIWLFVILLMLIEVCLMCVRICFSNMYCFFLSSSIFVGLILSQMGD